MNPREPWNNIFIVFSTNACKGEICIFTLHFLGVKQH